MEYTSKKLSETKIEFDCIFTETECDQIKQDAIKKIGEHINIPGFRKGHAPESVVKMNVSESDIEDKSLDIAMRRAYQKVMSENKNKYYVIGQAKVDIKDLKSFRLLITLEIKPEVDLGDYRKVKVKIEPVNITEDDINKEINIYREKLADKQEVDRPCQLKDWVKIKITAKNLNDEDIPEMERLEFSFEVGDKTYIPELTKEVVGLKAGEEKSFNVKLPEDFYRKQYANTKCKINIKVIEVIETILPEVNDDFVKLIMDEEVSVEYFIDKIRKYLSHQQKTKNIHKAYDLVIEKLLDTIKIEVPEHFINLQMSDMIESAKNKLKPYNISWEKYLEIQGNGEEILADYKKQSEAIAKKYMIINEIILKEKMMIDEKEMETIINEEMLALPKKEQASYKRKFSKNSDEYTALESTLLYNRVLKSFTEE